MAELSLDLGKKLISNLLSEIREQVKSNELDLNRLPTWVVGADIRFGWVNETCIALIRDGTKPDKYAFQGRLHSDVSLLLDVPDFEGRTGAFKPGARTSHESGPAMVVGPPQATTGGIIDLKVRYPNLVSVADQTSHISYFICQMLLRWFLEPSTEVPYRVSYLPLVVYLHRETARHLSRHWKIEASSVVEWLIEVANGEEGDFYAGRAARINAISDIKDTSVIVLGSYQADHLRELETVRDQIGTLGYDAVLIKDLRTYALS